MICSEYIVDLDVVIIRTSIIISMFLTTLLPRHHGVTDRWSYMHAILSFFCSGKLHSFLEWYYYLHVCTIVARECMCTGEVTSHSPLPSLSCSQHHCHSSSLYHPRWHSNCQLQYDVIPPVQYVTVTWWHSNSDKRLWSIWHCTRIIQLFYFLFHYGNAPQWWGQLHLLSNHHPQPTCSDRGVQWSCLCSCLWWVLLACTLEQASIHTLQGNSDCVRPILNLPAQRFNYPQFLCVCTFHTYHTSSSLHPAHPFIWDHPVDQTVNQSSQATFSCTAQGNPVPAISWTGPSDNFTTEDTPGANFTMLSVLTIDSAVRALHEGLYTCSASNVVGPPSSSSANLTVHGTAGGTSATQHQMHIYLPHNQNVHESLHTYKLHSIWYTQYINCHSHPIHCPTPDHITQYGTCHHILCCCFLSSSSLSSPHCATCPG